MPDFRSRFAPSPTGRLHLGHAYAALVVEEAARAAGGDWLLRIEDIDQTRCRPEFETAIFEDLAWLGLRWPEPVRIQSQHFDDYAAALSRLGEMNAIYRCFKTRKEILEEIQRAPHDAAGDAPEGGVYRGPVTPLSDDESEARAAAGEAFAWRLSMTAARRILGARWDNLSFVEETLDGAEARETAATPDLLGDLVVARKDAAVSYHLASVWDDARDGVSHVVRGEDLRTAAHVHRVLQELLDFPAPRYRHHRLILNDAGVRLAKRDASYTLKAMRDEGVSPADIRARLGL